MRIIATLTDATSIRRYLEGVGLPADPPRIAPARPPPQHELDFAAGFSLHAATRIEADDRRRLERLCRYVVRPPVAAGRLRFADPETLVFSLKTPWSDGTCQLVLSPHELIEKLVALVPPPRVNLIRYHGVLAPAAPDRAQIVPGPSSLTQAADEAGDGESPEAAPRRYRVAWAQLLGRVFQVDVTLCPSCGGRMRIIAATPFSWSGSTVQMSICAVRQVR